MAAPPLSVAVVTGGHSFDVPSFHRLFRGLADVDAYVQHMDDFASSPEAVRDAYDAVVFYIMLRDGPTNDGLPWYAGKPRDALEHLGAAEQGIVVLHHAILAYPQWPVWQGLVGIADTTFGYHVGESIHVEVADTAHPVTSGLSDWDMVDETYSMADAGEGSHVLLTVDHPKSMRTIAWTRRHRAARVFCLQLGHDDRAWSAPSFREVLRRGVLWSARRL